MVKVSVIMPVYNVEKYLKEALDSVINQSLKDIEIICVNDGSTDSSLQILREYEARDSRIKVISKENSGYGHTVNVGLNMACGEYIGLVETDDFIDVTMFEELYEAGKRSGAEVVKSGCRRFVEKDGQYSFTEYPILRTHLEEHYEKLVSPMDVKDLFFTEVATWNSIYKRSFLDEHSIRHNETPGASFQDNGFFFQIVMYAKKIYYMNKVFYNLRRDNPNSSVFNKGKLNAFFDEFAFIKTKILESELSNKEELLSLWNKMRLRNCDWHLKRIAPQYRKEFWGQLCREFEATIKKKELYSECFYEYDWEWLYTLLHSPEPCFLGEDILKDAIDKQLDSCTAIHIYGAGKWANRIFERIEKSTFRGKVKDFIVSKQSPDQTEMNGLPVVALSDAKISDTDVIVIAVDSKFYEEIITNLHHSGYRNYIFKNRIPE